FSDTFTPDGKSQVICNEAVSGKPCGMSYPRAGVESPGRVVFLSFPLDTVPTNAAAPNNEVTLLRNVFSFLAPGANGAATIYFDKKDYTAPDRVIVEIGDSDLTGAGQTQAAFSSSSSAGQVVVTLNETAHPGLFRGAITLVSSNAAADELTVSNGDIITATYFDVSRGSNVVATAIVDTLAPDITNVVATPDISSATVTWRTSKSADSLLQYGESSILSHTAYNADLSTNHSLTISGLLANHTYYFQVTSRDDAGNATVDDNHGALYTFTTVQTLRPPWSDDFESGALGWTVVTDTNYGYDFEWTLGTPNNGLQTSGHNSSTAWGSDLNGQNVSFIDHTYLISPEIDLSGLSEAKLTFWHCFDFSSAPYEEGQLLIRTGGSTSLSSLPVLADYSGDSAPDWRKETNDLTAYVGQTVQLVWEYAGVFGISQYYGWLVDDVSITGIAGSGKIVISKNLGEGSYTLTGPLRRTGKAAITTISNAPPGEYTVKFSDVTFYQTPTAQTNTLDDGGTVNFDGNYTFIDVNSNGISDAWEKYYFGAAGTNRTQFADSDGDGMSDYAEFIAGTNPTNAASKFIFVSAVVQTNRVQLKWSVIPGRLYQLDGSTDLINWTPVTGWQQAVTSPMSYSGTNAATGLQFFRVDVEP
ncbi:MAG TPA: choice-of-anchor J domain-containing protein, partial [Verrucomicrobiae bacterium]|nr:choice-of-anchor J domain-containing protein [Verrucomicrobiae bacterium]